MRIYIKNPKCDVTPAQLMAHIRSHDSVIGLCLTSELATHYLFDVKNDELRRYPIRMNTKTALDHYTVLQHNDFENPTSPTHDKTPKISTHHSFFTPDEIENIIKDEKKCPYLAGSPLSHTQQDLLYSGVVASGLGMSFYYFLNEYILPLPNPEKVLQGAITHKEIAFNDDDKQGASALQSLRYHFLAPNRIVFFDERLYPDALYKPTVGAVLDFYTHCIQTALKKLRHEVVAIADLRTYSDRSRAAELGNLQYHFTEDEIHEPQGLGGVNDVIFRFATLLLSPENQKTEDISALINNPGHTDFLEHKIALYRAITDLISAIETDSMTKIRSYLSAYDNIDAIIPREGWKSNFLTHLMSAQSALFTELSGTEVIENDQRITEEQRAKILEKIEGKADCNLAAKLCAEILEKIKGETDCNLAAKLFIMLYCDIGILNAKNVKLVLAYRNPSKLQEILNESNDKKQKIKKVIENLVDDAFKHWDGRQALESYATEVIEAGTPNDPFLTEVMRRNCCHDDLELFGIIKAIFLTHISKTGPVKLKTLIEYIKNSYQPYQWRQMRQDFGFIINNTFEAAILFGKDTSNLFKLIIENGAIFDNRDFDYFLSGYLGTSTRIAFLQYATMEEPPVNFTIPSTDKCIGVEQLQSHEIKQYIDILNSAAKKENAGVVKACFVFLERAALRLQDLQKILKAVTAVPEKNFKLMEEILGRIKYLSTISMPQDGVDAKNFNNEILDAIHSIAGIRNLTLLAGIRNLTRTIMTDQPKIITLRCKISENNIADLHKKFLELYKRPEEGMFKFLNTPEQPYPIMLKIIKEAIIRELKTACDLDEKLSGKTIEQAEAVLGAHRSGGFHITAAAGIDNEFLKKQKDMKSTKPSIS